MEKEYINPPTHCDICCSKIEKVFTDGPTVMGPWANMCSYCWKSYGMKTNIESKWIKKDDKFVKVTK